MSLCKCASYRQNGLSIVVHSFINSMEPPGSADMSQIPSNLCGSPGAPSDICIHGSWDGESKVLASGTVSSLEQSGAQYIPLMMTEAYGAICIDCIVSRGTLLSYKHSNIKTKRKMMRNRSYLFVERRFVPGWILFVFFLVVPSTFDPFQIIFTSNHTRIKLCIH